MAIDFVFFFERAKNDNWIGIRVGEKTKTARSRSPPTDAKINPFERRSSASSRDRQRTGPVPRRQPVRNIAERAAAARKDDDRGETFFYRFFATRVTGGWGGDGRCRPANCVIITCCCYFFIFFLRPRDHIIVVVTAAALRRERPRDDDKTLCETIVPIVLTAIVNYVFESTRESNYYRRFD